MDNIAQSDNYCTVRPVCGEREEIEERTKFYRDTLNQEKHDEVTDPTSTERPVLVELKEEHEIDFREPGVSHAALEEAEHLRVHELVKRSKIILIEKHFMRTYRITSTTHSEKFEGDDPRIGQCGIIRVVRNFSKSTMLSLSSFRESRNCVLHLRTMLD